MKRILQFRKSEKGYAIFKDETNLFEICRETLQFDVKNFYQAFYSDDNDFDDIEIENCIQDDKVAFRVYGCITNLMQQIKDKMKELDGVPKKESD